MTTKTKQVAVIGNGIIGISTAIWLQRAGYKVTLIDKSNQELCASYGNGGVLASCSLVPINSPGLLTKAPRMLFSATQPLFLKWGYLPKMLPWLWQYLSRANTQDCALTAAAIQPLVADSVEQHRALAQGTGAEKFIIPSDYLYVYDNREHFESDAFGWSLRAKHGIEWSELEGEQFTNYDDSFAGSLDFAAKMEHHARINDPGAYLQTLKQHVLAQGGVRIKGKYEHVVCQGNSVEAVLVDGQEIPCDIVVLATGAWSKSLAADLGVDVPLESERGYHLDLWQPNFMPKSPVMVAGSKFVITPMQGRIRLAGIVEFGGLEAKPSAKAFNLLRNSVKRAIPELTWSHESQWMGHRPAPADSIPIIGEISHQPGVFLGFGHHHVGLTSGPKTGWLLAQMIAGERLAENVNLYSPNRFVKEAH
ncbi:MAG TPA: FAD-dependent oxidoreductase [Oceanospirillaceae bacterium]|nr:FAD-dependent oxidoreductase [Oceanospirillaceae bacterium]